MRALLHCAEAVRAHFKPGVSQPANRLEAMSGRGQGGRRGGAAPDRGRDEDAVSDASGSARARRGEMPQVR